MTLPEAVLQIDGQTAITPPVPSRKYEPAELKKLLLPEKNNNNNRVITYLTGHGIYSTLIDYCFRIGRLAAETIKTLLSFSYIIFDEPAKRGKDMNDYLKVLLGLQLPRELERL